MTTHYFNISFITGCMLGIELLDEYGLEEENSWGITIDLLILRIMYFVQKEPPTFVG